MKAIQIKDINNLLDEFKSYVDTYNVSEIRSNKRILTNKSSITKLSPGSPIALQLESTLSVVNTYFDKYDVSGKYQPPPSGMSNSLQNTILDDDIIDTLQLGYDELSTHCYVCNTGDFNITCSCNVPPAKYNTPTCECDVNTGKYIYECTYDTDCWTNTTPGGCDTDSVGIYSCACHGTNYYDCGCDTQNDCRWDCCNIGVSYWTFSCGSHGVTNCGAHGISYCTSSYSVESCVSYELNPGCKLCYSADYSHGDTPHSSDEETYNTELQDEFTTDSCSWVSCSIVNAPVVEITDIYTNTLGSLSNWTIDTFDTINPNTRGKVESINGAIRMYADDAPIPVVEWSKLSIYRNAENFDVSQFPVSIRFKIRADAGTQRFINLGNNLHWTYGGIDTDRIYTTPGAVGLRVNLLNGTYNVAYNGSVLPGTISIPSYTLGLDHHINIEISIDRIKVKSWKDGQTIPSVWPFNYQTPANIVLTDNYTTFTSWHEMAYEGGPTPNGYPNPIIFIDDIIYGKIT